MELTLSNRAMQPMSAFALQMNKNSFGLVPAQPLQVGDGGQGGARGKREVLERRRGAREPMGCQGSKGRCR